ncbi:MAG: sugar phosphate isomerase/epimerase family protein [Gaiellaceae bacterium]
MGAIRVGPARCPSRESPELAVELLLERGYSACELDFESGFWMDYPWAERLRELAGPAGIALSVHAPLFAFPGHPDARKGKQALGALDRTAGIAAASGAEVVVIHPGFWLGRDRQQTLDDVVRWLEELRERLEQKDRAVPFGVEVMGRVSELGSIDDVLELSSRVSWLRPVIDFAHMHATSDGAFTDTEAFASVLQAVDAVLEPGAPFHIHFSDIAYANRNETKHLPYGEGTLRAEPLKQALRKFRRTANVISESPDLESSLAIQAVLASARTPSRRASSSSASSSRPRSRRN